MVKQDDTTAMLSRALLSLILLIGGGSCIGTVYGWKVGLGVALLILFLK